MNYSAVIMGLAALLLVACRPAASPTIDQSVEPTRVEEPGQAPRVKVTSTPGDASEEMFVLTGVDGEELSVPGDIREGVEGALSPTVLRGGTLVVFDRDNALHLVSTSNWDGQVIAKFRPDTDVLDYGWTSADGRWLAAIVREPGVNEPMVRALIFSLGDDDVLASQRALELDPAPLIRCYSRCTVVDARFGEDGTFEYLISGGPEDPEDADAAPVWRRAE